MRRFCTHLFNNYSAVVAIIAAALLFIVTPKTTPAGVAIGASPALLEFDSNPGVVEQRQVTVNNDGSLPIAVESYIWDWRMKGLEKEFAPPGAFANSLANWVQVAPRSAIIEPGRQYTFDVLFTVPQDAKGAHYGVLFFETKPQVSNSEQDKVAAVNARVGILLLHRTIGHSKQALIPKNFRVLPPTAAQTLKLNWIVENSGNAHALPNSQISVLNDKNQLVLSLDGTPARVFPGQNREFSLESAATLPPGRYRALLVIQYDANVTTAATSFVVR